MIPASWSRVSTWLRCGVQYYRRWEAGEVIPPGVALVRGSAFHYAAEINHREMVSRGEPMPNSDLRDAARDSFVSRVYERGVFMTPEEAFQKETILNDGLNQSLAAVDRYYLETVPELEPLEIERDIAITLGDLELKGKLDLIERRCIRDFKVRGKRKNQTWADRDLQPGFYYLLYESQFGTYPNIFIFDEIVTNKETKRYTYPTDRTEVDINRILGYLQSFAADIRAGIFRPASPDSWMCTPKWCGYFNSCPYGGLQRKYF